MGSDLSDMLQMETADDAIRQFLQHPAAAKFASYCAAYLMARESLTRRHGSALMKAEIAAHEAGHAINAAAIGVELQGANIFPRDGRWGGCVIPSKASPIYGPGMTADKIGAFMCIYVGGYLGERAIGLSGFGTAAHDLGIAFYLAKGAELLVPGITAKSALRAALTLSCQVIATNRATFERVANALEAKTKLSAGELTQCLCDVSAIDPVAWLDLAREGGGDTPFTVEEECLAVADALAKAPGAFEPPARSAVARGYEAAIAEIERHQQTALMFSGGKESLVLAHMLRPYRDRITLVWANTGAMFPHMVEFIRSFARRSGYEFAEVHSNQAASFAQNGWPANVIPIYQDPTGKLKTTSRLSCCARLRMDPVLLWMGLKGIKALIHGQRQEDGNPLLAFSGDGAEIAPLWDWSAADVFRYIGENSIELPEQYGAGYADSGECWNCPSEIDHERFQWMQRRYPELLLQVVPMIAKIYGGVQDHMAVMRPGFDAALAAYDAIRASR